MSALAALGWVHGVRWAALALAGAAGVVLVRGDVRDQRIRNRHILWCLGAGAVGYALLAAHTWAGWSTQAGGYLLPAYYSAAGVHIALSASAGIALWQLRLWPAGDAKLFLMLAFLMPLALAPAGFDPWRAWLMALVNIFIPAALFMVGRSAWVVWRLYLRDQAAFLARLGWGALPSYLLQGLQAVPWRERLAAWAEPLKTPWRLVPALAFWAGSMLLASAVAMRLQSALGSTLLVSGLCFALMLAWNKATARWGKVWVFVLGVAATAALVDWRDPASVRQAGTFFASLSVFSLSLQWGLALARRMLEERGLVAAPLLAVGTWILPMVLVTITNAAWAKTLLVWAVLGTLFGLGHMLVRILEEQDRPILTLAQLRPTIVLADDFVEFLRKEDEEFLEDELGTLYADGLTKDQAEALKGWCEERGVDRVPLTETVSFAFWIYLGFILTWLLGGHVLQAVL